MNFLNFVNPSDKGFWFLDVTSSANSRYSSRARKTKEKNAVTQDKQIVLLKNTVTSSAIFYKHLEKQEQAVQGPLACFTNNPVNNTHLGCNF